MSGTRLSGRLNKRGDTRGTYVTHDASKTRLYSIWVDMKRRCYNQKNKRYERYGGRGIRVCDEWRQNFETFQRWALLNGYLDTLTLERMDIDKGYGPDNCCWITAGEQQLNTSRTHWITCRGETLPMSEWARRTGLPVDLIKDRINKLHWTDEDAVTIARGAKKGIYGHKR